MKPEQLMLTVYGADSLWQYVYKCNFLDQTVVFGANAFAKWRAFTSTGTQHGGQETTITSL